MGPDVVALLFQEPIQNALDARLFPEHLTVNLVFCALCAIESSKKPNAFMALGAKVIP